MLLVVEGMDRTGKSTLAESLAAEYKLDLLHFEKPRQHPLAEYLRPIEAGPRRAVFDRYHLGERVWPNVFGRKSEYDEAMHLHVDLTLKSRGAVLVRPLRHWASEAEHRAALEGEPIDYEQWLAADLRFLELTRDSRLESFAWCLCHDSLERRAPFIRRAGDLARQARDLAAITPRWIGSTTPDVLLVGEQVGPGGQGKWTLPFVPFRGTSGHFLFTELAALPLPWQSRVALVNAYTPDGGNGHPEPLTQLWEQLGQPRVVALGKKADMELTRQSLEHGAVPHPQYVRRFLRKMGQGWYGKQIQEAAQA